MILELRCRTAEGEIGLQTIVPPSVHEGGEKIRFEPGYDRSPAKVDADVLVKAAYRTAAAALLARNWPKEGSRHTAFLALAGILCRAGWSDADRGAFHFGIYRALWGQAADLEKCLKEVDSTAERQTGGTQTTGYPTLAGLMNPAALKTGLEWIGITPSDSSRTKEDFDTTAAGRRLTYAGRPYAVHEGKLYGWKELRANHISFEIANFAARITADQIIDDGAEQTRVFSVEANVGGQVLAAEIPAKEFKSMNWVTEKLGGMAIVNPAQTEHARAAIQMLSGEIQSRHIFSCTGWRLIDGRNYYLHADGAIGPDGNRTDICVSLQDKLPHYRLTDPLSGDQLTAAIRASLQMLDVTLDRLTFPVYAAIWRSILGAATFSLHLAGSSGAGKSQLAALAQQHFGSAMDGDNLPASWLGTANATGTLAFYAKDALLVVDDFVPAGNAASQQKLHSEADKLLRAQGNSAGRRRLSSDGRLLANRPPRGLILSTGEDTPNGKSLNARLVLLHFPRGAMNWAKLTVCQEFAASGEFVKATSAFVQWLSCRLHDLQQAMRDQKLMRRGGSGPSGLHMRTPENLNALYFGLTTFLDFARSVGAISELEARALIDRAEIAFRETELGEARKHTDTEPAKIFLRLVRSAITMGKAYLAAPTGVAPEGDRPWGWYTPAGCQEKQSRGAKIGWVKEDEIFLLADAAHSVAYRLAQEQGDILPGSVETIKRDLKEQGLLAKTDEKRRTITVRRTLEGEQQDVLVVNYASFQGASMDPADNADNADIQNAKITEPGKVAHS